MQHCGIQGPKGSTSMPQDLAKTLSYMCLHLVTGFTVAYLLTGSLAVAGGIALIEPLVNTVALYCGTVDCLAVTKYGPAVIDWKTTDAIRKAKRKGWMKHQLAAYAGCINRLFELEPVKQGINVVLAPDGMKTYRYEEAEFLEAWTNLKGLLRDYWAERCAASELDDEPGMACEALEKIEATWGPFEPVANS